MRVLCVAEKPSAAKKIAEILSQSKYSIRSTNDPHVKNYNFTYNQNNRSTAFVMTAVKGHLRELHFEGGINKNWSDYPLEDLFRTPLTKIVPTHFKPLADNITQEIKYSDTLFIWTDCDREGEAIGADIADLCLRTKPNLTVWRARFSAMQPNEIHYAAQHPTQLDMKQVEAVRARSELDLRIGAAFTRLQTINLRPYFSSSAKNKVLSYGSCQFPTLGFVVDRYLQVQNFIPEEFWKIVMTYAQPNQGEQQQQQQQKGQASLKTTFNWRRDHLFDRWACFTLYEKCFEKKIATVTKVKSKQTSKWKPLPLTTVEMQKIGCRVLNMSGSHLMTIAEGLYTSGLISYPRTETDQYDSSFDFMKYINMQTQDSQWGQYARLLRDGEFEKPRNGKNNDKAHPPIHPTGYDARLSGDPKRVYEFITRRFLASCWKNAIGFETAVEVKIDTEYFDTKGLVILEKNFLEVYTYDKWKGNEIPEFHEGDEFIPDQLEMQRGQTTPPRLLTEPDLISMMEKNEIGTDATIAEHIQKILDREYVYKENQYFKPLTLGIALILGYDQIGLEASLSKPFLRRQMEADLKLICEGSKTPSQVLARSINQYRDMFDQLKADFSKIRQSMDRYFREGEDGDHISRRGRSGGSYGGSNNNDDDHNEGGEGGSGTTNRRGRGRGRGSSYSTRGNNASTRTRGRGRGSSSSTSNNNRSTPHNNIPLPKCAHHDKPMVLRTVQKEGPNKGRNFYVCSDNLDQCNAFEWVDEHSSSLSGTLSRNNSNNNSSNSNSIQTNSIVLPRCHCGIPGVERTVTKDSPNKGRVFYSCSLGRDHGCDYFEWADAA